MNKTNFFQSIFDRLKLKKKKALTLIYSADIFVCHSIYIHVNHIWLNANIPIINWNRNVTAALAILVCLNQQRFRFTWKGLTSESEYQRDIHKSGKKSKQFKSALELDFRNYIRTFNESSLMYVFRCNSHGSEWRETERVSDRVSERDRQSE